MPMKKYLRKTGDEKLDLLVMRYDEPMDFLPTRLAVYYTQRVNAVLRIPLGRKGNSRHVVTNSMNQDIYKLRAKGEKYKFKVATGYHNDDRGSYQKAKYHYRLFVQDEKRELTYMKDMSMKDGKVMNGGNNPPDLKDVLYVRTMTRVHKSGQFTRKITEFLHTPENFQDLLNKRLVEYIGSDKNCSTYHGNRRHTKQKYIYRGNILFAAY